ncbi:peptidase [Cellulomonas pakistanensis]|uniref:Gram-positive cocci surface proteins LPxTG domain-containing protein n=1 Tax=Cellulomonas pakistanensis TaxID=992287 RepID=A0A919PBH4_9CELL|nr:peptidase [Cellulomonas pakistanensis]GIG37964.1 hypothetical protein Cpa01nite_33450 [Cellulomonas pakistanensis]
MARARRIIGTLAAAAVVVLGSVLPAQAGPPAASAVAAPALAAAVVDPCEQPTDGYAPPPECELLVAEAAGVCLEAAPVLRYAVEATGTTDDTLSITWVDPEGADITQDGLPLSGWVYWPGTVVKDGVVVDWPGWHLTPEGTWSEHDAYDFTRPEVQVVLEVNPSATTVVAYPPETAVCANPPGASGGPGAPGGEVEQVAGVVVTSDVLAAPEDVRAASAVLAVTGSDATPLVVAAALLLLVGGVLVALPVRRRHREG